MAGMTTRSATTMFRVVDVEVTLGQFRDWLFGLLEESGWNLGREDAALLAEDVAEAADAFDVGTVLERRSDDIQNALRTSETYSVACTAGGTVFGSPQQPRAPDPSAVRVPVLEGAGGVNR